MKTYIITCLDKKNSLKKRLANRELHLKYLKSLKNKLILAGPILNRTNKPKGSVLILKFQNKFELNFLSRPTFKCAHYSFVPNIKNEFLPI